MSRGLGLGFLLLLLLFDKPSQEQLIQGYLPDVLLSKQRGCPSFYGKIAGQNDEKRVK